MEVFFIKVIKIVSYRELDVLRDFYKILVLSEGESLYTGGVVFSKAPSDMEYAVKTADEWFAKGYLYLGYIWTCANYRGMGYGSCWFDCLFEYLPYQKYWLTIEDYSLINFYKKKGFKLIKEMRNKDKTEWLLAQV